jgi:hypothetical protein
VKRWNHNGEVQWTKLKSKYAIQSDSASINVQDVIFEKGPGNRWMYVSPDQKTIVAAIMRDRVLPLSIYTPEARLELEGVKNALIIWENGSVTINTDGLSEEPKGTGINISEIILFE